MNNEALNPPQTPLPKIPSNIPNNEVHAKDEPTNPDNGNPIPGLDLDTEADIAVSDSVNSNLDDPDLEDTQVNVTARRINDKYGITAVETDTFDDFRRTGLASARPQILTTNLSLGVCVNYAIQSSASNTPSSFTALVNFIKLLDFDTSDANFDPATPMKFGAPNENYRPWVYPGAPYFSDDTLNWIMQDITMDPNDYLEANPMTLVFYLVHRLTDVILDKDARSVIQYLLTLVGLFPTMSPDYKQAYPTDWLSTRLVGSILRSIETLWVGSHNPWSGYIEKVTDFETGLPGSGLAMSQNTTFPSTVRDRPEHDNYRLDDTAAWLAWFQLLTHERLPTERVPYLIRFFSRLFPSDSAPFHLQSDRALGGRLNSNLLYPVALIMAKLIEARNTDDRDVA